MSAFIYVRYPYVDFERAAEKCVEMTGEEILEFLKGVLVCQRLIFQNRKMRNRFFSRLRWWFCKKRHTPMCATKIEIVALLSRLRWHQARNEAMREVAFRNDVRLAIALGLKLREFENFHYIHRYGHHFLQNLRAFDLP